ncbi:MAG: GNAT family N-acetyltransferase [Chloroflexota bacterium]
MKNPMMVGERVYLSPVEPDDAMAFARAEAIETDTRLYPPERLPTSPIGFEQMARELGKSTPPAAVMFAVRLKETDEWIGEMGLWHIKWVDRSAETGSFMKPGEFRGRGYGTEAKMLLLEYAFDHLHLHLIWSGVMETNKRSAAALTKQGYKPAGAVRYQTVKDGVYVGDGLYTLTREDWLAKRDERDVSP